MADVVNNLSTDLILMRLDGFNVAWNVLRWECQIKLGVADTFSLANNVYTFFYYTFSLSYWF